MGPPWGAFCQITLTSYYYYKHGTGSGGCVVAAYYWACCNVPCVFSFIRLVDYLVVNTVHSLAVNSISSLLSVFSTQLSMTPPVSVIQGWTSVLNDIPEVPELADKVSTLQSYGLLEFRGNYSAVSNNIKNGRQQTAKTSCTLGF